MKHIHLLLCLFFTSFCASAQNDFKPLTSIDDFKTLLYNESKVVNSIQSDFTQTKHVEMLSEKVVSKGKFYYKKENKICLDYSSPVKYLIVINEKKIKIVADGKKNVYELGSNKMMKEMQTLLSACMTGNLNLLSSEYKLDYKANNTSYWINVKPLGGAKAYMQQIDIYLDKKDLSVQTLKMTETSSDYTEYVFTNKKKNTEISNEKFSLK